ncbi:MAG: DUF3017 domain-containing protein [Kineosporiaceae bacterium]
MVQWEVPPTRRIAFVVVLGLMAASVVVTLAMDDFRPGGYLLAAAMALAAVIRGTLPEKYCLGLLVRSRSFDVVTAAVFAVALAVTTAVVPA